MSLYIAADLFSCFSLISLRMFGVYCASVLGHAPKTSLAFLVIKSRLYVTRFLYSVFDSLFRTRYIVRR